MHGRLEKLIAEARGISDPSARRIAIISLLRVLLQHVCIGLLEYCVQARSRDRNASSSLAQGTINALYRPADGDLVQALEELSIAVESFGWTSVARLLLSDRVGDRPCAKFLPGQDGSLSDLLRAFVFFRNSTEAGHGFPGQYDLEAEHDVATFALSKLQQLLPRVEKDGESLVLATAQGDLKLRMLRAFNGNFINIREYRRLRSGNLLARVQVATDLRTSFDQTFEVPDLIRDLQASKGPAYSVTEVSESWRPLTYVPDPLTDDFKGRRAEIRELVEWWNSPETSLACQVFGDGGIGKTTLVLEFLHEVLNGQIHVAWRPEVITYFTAKRTRWGTSGLEYLTGANLGLSDAALQIVTLANGFRGDRTWFAYSPEQAIMRAGQVFEECWGVKRNAHLIILDNTETMLERSEDAIKIGRQLDELKKRLGRVLVTSRRRESFEAHPIELKSWTEEECEEFLRARAERFGKSQVNQAGSATLRRLARRFSQKPLLMEAFVRSIALDGSLEKAADVVSGLQAEDLGQFLFEDAWKRIGVQAQRLLLLMAEVSDVSDQACFRLCCSRADVAVIRGEELIRESVAMASIALVSGQTQVTLNPEFLKFCASKRSSYPGGTVKCETDAAWVRSRYQIYLRAQTSTISDRVSEAFRDPNARAAHLAYREGKYDVCVDFLRDAVHRDTSNGALWDRLAHSILKSRGDLDEALAAATEAVRLLPGSGDTHFTRGRVLMRMSRTDEAVASLTRAAKEGKQKYLVSLQCAYACMSAEPQRTPEAMKYLRDAKKFVSHGAMTEDQRWKFEIELRRAFAKVGGSRW